MAITQVQFRLSIDGQQALSEMSALELKIQETAAENKRLSDEKTAQDKIFKDSLVEINKLQEKQVALTASMAKASELGNLVQLTKLEQQYEANEAKMTALLDVQIQAGIEANKNNEIIAENNKQLRTQKIRLDELYLAEGDVLRQEASLVKEKKALAREISLAGNNSARQQKAEERLIQIEKELALRVADRTKATISGIQKIVKEEGFEKVSTQQLIELQKSLEQAEKHRQDRSSEAHKEELKQIHETKAELAKRREETEVPSEGGIMGMLKNVKSGILPGVVGGLIGSVSGGIIGGAVDLLGKLAGSFGDAIDRIKKKALEITAIQTSLDVSRAKAREINSELSSINTVTAVSELNKLVEVAGDLNIPVAEIKEFVTQADQIGTVMGREMGGAEEAVTMIAKLKEEFRQTRDLRADEALQKIGSMLKQLNLSGPATTQGITEFLKRVGNIPDAIKPSISQLAGFAAVFEESNLSAEISATALTNILTIGANNIATFAKQMRMSSDAVRDLINNNPNEFILKFGESLRGLKGDELARTLKILHLEGTESIKTMGVLSDNLAKVREKQELASDAMLRGATVSKIFNDINSDEAAKIEKISKSWESVKSSLTSWVALLVGPVINSMAKLTEKTETLGESYKKQEQKVKMLSSSTQPLINKMFDLANKTDKTKQDTEDLQATIAKIGSIVPEAVTQWNQYGEAMQINLGIIDEQIRKQTELQNLMKIQYKNEYTNQNNELFGQKKELTDKLNRFTYLGNQLRDKSLESYTRGRFQLEYDQLKGQIPGIQAQIKEIVAKVQSNWNAKHKLEEVVDFKPETGNTTNPPTGNGGLTKEDKTGSSDPNKKAKYLQDQHNQLLELEAKLAFEERLALASDEDKKLIIVDEKAKQERLKVRNQFKDINGIEIEYNNLSKEQQELIGRELKLIDTSVAAERLEIQKDFLKKQDEAYENHANRAIQIAHDARKEELQNDLSKAQKRGDRVGVYQTQKSIINTDESAELYALKISYLKQQQEAEKNADALKLIEENFQKAKEAIEQKYKNKRSTLLDNAIDEGKGIYQKNKIDRLQLDTTDPSQNQFEAKKALLEAQRQAELDNAEKTGADVLNINRKYNQQRDELERSHLVSVAEQAVSYYQQAFSSIAKIFSMSLQNRMTAEQKSYDRSIDNLDQQKAHGILTNRQYNKQRELLDKEHAKKELALKREQWEQEKAATISNIVMQTALAIMKAAPNVPLQILTGVTGGIELGVALSEANPYSMGGDVTDKKTGKLSVAKKPSPTAVLAWLNEEGPEFVVNNTAIRHPAFADIKPVLEMLNSGANIPGYAKGGLSGNISIPSSSNYTNIGIDIAKFEQNIAKFGTLIDQFGQIIQQPISANVAIGHEEIYKLEQEKNKLLTSLNEAYSSTNNSLL